MKCLLRVSCVVTLMVVTVARSIPVRAHLSPVEGGLAWGEQALVASKAVTWESTGGVDAKRQGQWLVKRATNDHSGSDQHHGRRLYARAKGRKKPLPGEPRYPTREEIEAILDRVAPEKNAELEEARAGMQIYRAAVAAQKAAKAAGRALTDDEKLDLEYGQKCSASYESIRHFALREIALGPNPPPEVFAKYQEWLDVHRDRVKDWYSSLEPEQRDRLNDRKATWDRARRAERAGRIEELEALVKEQPHDQALQRELDDLKAQKVQKIGESQTKRAKNQQAIRELEGRIQDKTASPEDEKTWADIQAKKAERNDRRNTRRKNLRRLEKIMNDPAGNPTDEQRAEWDVHIDRKESQKAAREAAQKARQGSTVVEATQDEGRDQSSQSRSGESQQSPTNTDGDNPSIGEPLRFSKSGRRSPQVHQPSWLANPVANLKQVGHQIPQMASMGSNQLKGVVQNGLQSISTSVKNRNWQRQPISVPLPKFSIPAGGRIPVT